MTTTIEQPGYLTRNDYFLAWLDGLQATAVPANAYGPNLTGQLKYVLTISGNLYIFGPLQSTDDISPGDTLLFISSIQSNFIASPDAGNLIYIDSGQSPPYVFLNTIIDTSTNTLHRSSSTQTGVVIASGSALYLQVQLTPFSILV